ncbi:hypothetical protein Tco_1143052 [Tanacetum coccineum]
MTCGTELTDGVCLQCCPYPNYYDNTPNYSNYPPQPEYQTYSCESYGNDAHYGYPCPSFVPDSCYKTPPVMEEEQTQPEYLQELLQSLLKDLQILNEINLKHELLQSEDQGRERNVNPRFGDSEAAVLERDDEYG